MKNNMKNNKLFITIIAIAFAVTNSNAQAFEEGTKVVAIGYGFPNLGKSLFKVGSDNEGYKATGFGPIHGRFEYGLTDKFGIGLSINFNSFGAKYSDPYYDYLTGTYLAYTNEFKYTSVNFLIRGNRHWDVNDKVDIFSGFGLGYNYAKATWKSSNTAFVDDTFDNIIPIGFEWTVGMRYYFSDNVGGYIEGGYAKSILQAGIVAKF